MKKVIASLLTLVGSSSFIFTAAFPKVEDGCNDPSYRFATLLDTQEQREAASVAKMKFCMTAGW